MKIDLKKFKKISSDKHSTTLKHPDGHEIRVAHSALSPKMRGDLAKLPTAMAEGGEVEAEKNDRKKSGDNKGKTIGEIIGYPGSGKPKMDEGTQMLADGGEVDQQMPNPASTAQEQQQPQQAPVVVNVNSGQPAPQASPQPAPESVPHYLGNAVRQGVVDTIQALGMVAKPVAKGVGELGRGFAGEPSQGPLTKDAPPVEAGPAPASIPQEPQGIAPGASQPQGIAPAAPQDTFGIDAYNKAYAKGIDEQKAGIMGQAQAMGMQGQAEAKALQAHVQAQQEVLNTYKDHVAQLDQERKAFIQDYQNQHIDPQHFLASQGTGAKIKTAIGLILGGFGAAAGQQNLPMQFLNQQIQNDIDAQRAEMGKKENLLNANMKQFQNLRDATDMTRVMQQDIVSSQLKQAAATAMSPLAKAQALQAAGKLDMESAAVLSQIAMRKSILGGVNSGKVDPARVVNMLIPENQRGEANKELKEAQSVVAARDNILASFDKLSQINTLGHAVTSPIQTSKQVAAIRDPLIASLSKETAGRFTDSDAKMVGSLFPAKGDSAETLATKRAQLQKLISEKLHFPILETYGIKADSLGRFGAGGQSRIQESAPVVK